MNREQERIRKNLEKNPVAECNKFQKKYYPMLFEKFAGVKDPRHQSYIEYTTKTMLGTLYYKCLGRIESMREMTRKFNDEQIVENLYSFLGERKKAMKQIYLSQLIKQFRNCFFHSCVLHWNKCVFRK